MIKDKNAPAPIESLMRQRHLAMKKGSSAYRTISKLQDMTESCTGRPSGYVDISLICVGDAVFNIATEMCGDDPDKVEKLLKRYRVGRLAK